MNGGREETVDEFFRLESELQEIARAGRATPEVAGAESGLVLDVSRVPRTELPVDYPVPTSGERALALALELDTGHERTVFLDWPDEGGDLDQLTGLLARAGVSFDSFADLYGSRVPVTVVGDFLVVPVQGQVAEAVATGSQTAAADDGATDSETAGQLVGMTALSFLWVIFVAALGSTDPAVAAGACVVVGFLLLGATVEDASHVATETAWSPSDWWTLAVAVFPPFAYPAYLWRRTQAFDD